MKTKTYAKRTDKDKYCARDYLFKISYINDLIDDQLHGSVFLYKLTVAQLVKNYPPPPVVEPGDSLPCSQ
jgi:hypothetical protein